MDDLASQGLTSGQSTSSDSVSPIDILKCATCRRHIRHSAEQLTPRGQIGAAAAFIRMRTRAPRVSIVAHSWGTIPAGIFSSEYPSFVDRLVDFGPVTQREGRPDTATAPAYKFMTQDAQRTRFDGYVPRGEAPVLDPSDFAVWGPAYLATDSSSRSRYPASVVIPNGPSPDINDAWSGHLPYDPSRIIAPVLIVRGEWDVVTRDADAAWLWSALTHASLKRDVKISRGTHVMHLEASRRQLYAEVAAFLAGRDSVGTHASEVPERFSGSRLPSHTESHGLGALSGPSSHLASTAAPHYAPPSTPSIGPAGTAFATDDVASRILRRSLSSRRRHSTAQGIAASPALVAIGPSCSSVAEPLYAVLPRGADDTAGIRIPVSPTAPTKADLARASAWASATRQRRTSIAPCGLGF